MGAQRSWRKSPVASDAPCDLREPDATAGLRGAGDGNQGSHGRHAVVDAGAVLRRSMKNGVGKSFNLPFVAVRIFAQRSMKLTVFHRKTFDMACLVEPGQEDLADY